MSTRANLLFFALVLVADQVTKVMAYTYLPPAIVILIEGASGRGWPPLEVLPGVALILLTLGLLLRDDQARRSPAPHR